VAGAEAFLNAFTGQAAFDMDDLDVLIFTTPPTELGTDGVEVTGGSYARQPLMPSAAAPGSTGRVAQTVSTTNLLFAGMPVASTDVEGLGLARRSDGVIVAVNDTWTPTDPFDIGGNLYIAPGDFAFYHKKA
jgi:hypothetical protein